MAPGSSLAAFLLQGWGTVNRSMWIWSHMGKCYVTNILAESSPPYRCGAAQSRFGKLGLTWVWIGNFFQLKARDEDPESRCSCRTELWPAGPECTEPSSLCDSDLTERQIILVTLPVMDAGTPLSEVIETTEAQASVSSLGESKVQPGWNCTATNRSALGVWIKWVQEVEAKPTLGPCGWRNNWQENTQDCFLRFHKWMRGSEQLGEPLLLF